jgi:DNA polymerase III sliding clamp (beta) subunit (PCNA family)
MLKELQFVQGAVARKDFQPALVHFHITAGKIQGYNGVLALGCPIALDLDVTPNATQLVKAVQSCKDTVAVSMTASGRLAIKSKNFKAFVECFPGGFPEIIPTGKRLEPTAPILPALRVLAPCIAEDASRQWARGILFRERSLFATNNVVLIEHYIGDAWPIEMNLPGEAVKELLRIGEEPESLLVEDGAVTFCFSGNRWLRSQLYTAQWPDVSRVLDTESRQAPLPFRSEALDGLAAFLDEGGRIYFQDGKASTSHTEGVGAAVELPNIPEKGIFNYQMLRLALDRASTFDFSPYPKPCPFFGERLRGVLMGMKA